MSSPPPGYNPDASQLHGGTDAPIAKVMGGGGGGPEGYNETQSLLQGGTDAPIVKMTGGAGTTKEAAAVAAEAAADKAEAEAAKAQTLADSAERERVAAHQATTNANHALPNYNNIVALEQAATSKATNAKAAAATAKAAALAARAAALAARAAADKAAAARAAANKEKMKDIAKEAADKAKAKVTFAPNAKLENGKGSPEKFKKELTVITIQAEVYEPSFSQEDTTEIREFMRSFSLKNPGLMPRYLELITSFRKRATEKWFKYSNSKPQTPPFPSVAASTLPVHKLVEVLPQTTANIIIIPPIKGNYEKFLRSVEFLYANNIINENDSVENAVIVFMSPLFGKDADAQRLLYSFLSLQEKNVTSVFALQGDDADSREVGAQFYEGTLNTDTIFLNYLNPSYLLLPRKVGGYDGILFTSDTGPEPMFPKIKNKRYTPVSELLKRKSAFSFNANTESDDTFKNYLTFASGNGSTELPATKADIEICGNLKTVFDMKDMKPFQISDVDDIYVLRLEKDRRPLLCANLMYTDEKFESGELDPAFHTAATVEVYVDGQKWTFRDPRQSEYRNVLDKIAESLDVPTSRNLVMQNWERAIYSASEAGFLNHVNLSPRILSETFGSDVWKKMVAKFLNNLVTSNCFEDTDILSKGQCEDTRIFLNEVFNRLFMMDSVKEGELVVPPLKFPPLPRGQGATTIVWPPELEEMKDDEFRMTEPLGSLDITQNSNTKTSFIELIVIHKPSFVRSARRLRINSEMVKAEIAPGGPIGEAAIFNEILEDLKEDYPDFLFIY